MVLNLVNPAVFLANCLSVILVTIVLSAVVNWLSGAASLLVLLRALVSAENPFNLVVAINFSHVLK